MAGRCQSGVAPRVVQIVGSQLGNVQGQVLFRGEDVVGLAVVVDVECHVTRHLTSAEVTLHDKALVYGLAPGGRPVFVVGGIQRVGHSYRCGVKLHRPRAGIGSRGIEKLVGTFGTVGHGHAVAGGIIALTLQLEVEPHAELLRHGVIDNLRTLQDTAALNVGARSSTSIHPPTIALTGSGLRHAQRHTAVAPVDQVLGGVAHHAHQCIAGAVVLVLTKPVVSVAIFQHTAAMGVDVAATVVVPQLSATDGLLFLLLVCPILLQALGLSLGDMDDRAVLGRHEVGQLHLTLAKVTKRCEGLEVGGLDEAEVIGTDGVDVVHDDPLLLADTLPHVGSFATRTLGVNLLGVVVVEVVDAV